MDDTIIITRASAACQWWIFMVQDALGAAGVRRVWSGAGLQRAAYRGGAYRAALCTVTVVIRNISSVQWANFDSRLAVLYWRLLLLKSSYCKHTYLRYRWQCKSGSYSNVALVQRLSWSWWFGVLHKFKQSPSVRFKALYTKGQTPFGGFVWDLSKTRHIQTNPTCLRQIRHV